MKSDDRLLVWGIFMTMWVASLTYGVLDHNKTLRGDADTLFAAPDTIYITTTDEEERVRWTNHYSRKFGVDSALALQISRAENTRAIPDAWSPSGCCVGDYQVHVRFHFGRFAQQCDGNDLLTHRDNACYGILLIREKLARCKGNIHCMLGLYGGATSDSTRTAYIQHVERYGTSF